MNQMLLTLPSNTSQILYHESKVVEYHMTLQGGVSTTQECGLMWPRMGSTVYVQQCKWNKVHAQHPEMQKGGEELAKVLVSGDPKAEGEHHAVNL